MPTEKVATKQLKNSNKNYVNDGAIVKVSKRVTQKKYIPGIYEHHHPSQCEHMLRSRPIHLKLQKATDGKDMVKIISRENIRDLLIPGNDINVYPAIWQQQELHRIRDAGKIISNTERQREIEYNEMVKKRLENECEKRKEFLKIIDEKNEKKKLLLNNNGNGEGGGGGGGGDDDDDSKIIDRAFLAKQEECEEVKQANRLILATKCHVIRDAQIAEKNEIDRELKEENLRLEKMMLQERDKALRTDDENREKLKEFNEKHAIEIKNQLYEREKLKMMEAERIDEEAKKIASAQIIITLDMMEKQKRAMEKKLKIRNELQKHNEINEYLKNLAFEEQRIADMKAQEYMRMKQERDRQIEIEKRLVTEQKQREADRLLKLQTKLLETKNVQADMNMRRTQEEKEREFRRKEKEAVTKRKEHEKQLLATRTAQLEEIKRMRALQLAKDENDFQCVVNKLKEMELKEQRQQQIENVNRKKYREEVIKQINENDINKREMKRRNKTEYYAELEREQQRNKNIKNVIAMKIKSMKDAKIPDKFIKDVERQLKVTLEN